MGTRIPEFDYFVVIGAVALVVALALCVICVREEMKPKDDDPEAFAKAVGVFLEAERDRIWQRLQSACRDDGTIRLEDAKKAVWERGEESHGLE